MHLHKETIICKDFTKRRGLCLKQQINEVKVYLNNLLRLEFSISGNKNAFWYVEDTFIGETYFCFHGEHRGLECP